MSDVCLRIHVFDPTVWTRDAKIASTLRDTARVDARPVARVDALGIVDQPLVCEQFVDGGDNAMDVDHAPDSVRE